MSIITSIKPQKNKKRVNIYLDDKFAFGLDLESLITLNLKEDTELSEEEIVKIVRKAEFQKVYDKMLRFASLRPRSKKEYELWLRKHKVHTSLHKSLFNKLKRLGFLDDEKFAVWWIEQRTSFRPRGVRALRSELGQKGINRELADQLISELVNRDKEEEMAKKLIGKKKYRWEKLEPFMARRKASAFLARKGFSWEVIKRVLVDLGW